MLYRVEDKYVVNEAQIAYLKERLKDFVSMDPHMKGDSYLIRSIYFDNMYEGCKDLVEADDIVVEKIYSSAFYGMFKGCISLKKAPNITVSYTDYTETSYAYSEMFQGCTSLETPPETLKLLGVQSNASHMFDGCTKLTESPHIKLNAPGTYKAVLVSMFAGCTSLNKITLEVLTGSSYGFDSNFSDWVNGVSSTGDFYYNGSATTRGTSAIPTGWTIHAI